MKWIKLLKDFDNRKAGEVYQENAAVADALVKTLTAEAATEPAAVASADAEIDVKAVAAELVDDLRKEFVAATKAASKAKRPGAASEADITTHDNALDDPKFGFKHIGEQLVAVKNYALRQGVADPRLKIGEKAIETKAPSSYASEGIGADGGFSVAPDFLPELLGYTYADDSILARCRPLTTVGNTLTVPKDETVAWGTDGVQAYWANEAGTFSPSKTKLGEINVTLHKLTALVPVTNELLDDSAFSIGAYIGRQAPIKIADKVNGALVSGTGAGQPLGVLSSGALITQNKDSGQSASTVTITNVANMYARMPAYMRSNAVWLHHSTVLPQILTMVIGNQPAYFPPGGVGSSPGGTLWGRPLVQSEQCKSLTNLGDINLIDFNQYLAVTKSNGIRQEMSIHLYFDQDLTAFRFVFRLGGQPWMSAPITQKNGGGTLSPFVQLQNR